MAQRIENYHVTPAVGTTPTNYQSDALDFPVGEVLAFVLHIPAGHRGQTGFQLAYGGTQVIPRRGDAYYIGNKESRRFELDDPFPGGNGWFAQSYNRGRYAHTFKLQVEIDEVTFATELMPPVILLPYAGGAPEAFDASQSDGSSSSPAPGVSTGGRREVAI